MSEWPHPAGTVVKAEHPEIHIPLVSGCKGHLYVLLNSPTPLPPEATYGCGFIQAAHCLVCGYDTAALDADFFREATEDDVAACILLIHSEIDRLHEAALDIAQRRNVVRQPSFALPVDL